MAILHFQSVFFHACFQPRYANITEMNHRLNFVHGNYNDPLPFEDETFDALYQVQVLTYTVDPVKLFQEALRVRGIEVGGIEAEIFMQYLSFRCGSTMVFSWKMTENDRETMMELAYWSSVWTCHPWLVDQYSSSC